MHCLTNNPIAGFCLILTCLILNTVARADLPVLYDPSCEIVIFTDEFNNNANSWSNVGSSSGQATMGTDPGSSTQNVWYPSINSDGTTVRSLIQLPEMNLAVAPITLYMRVRVDDINNGEANRFFISLQESNSSRYGTLLIRPVYNPMIVWLNNLGQEQYTRVGPGYTYPDTTTFVDFRLMMTNNDDGTMALDGYRYDSIQQNYIYMGTIPAADIETGIFNSLIIWSCNSNHDVTNRVYFDSVCVTRTVRSADVPVVTKSGLAYANYVGGWSFLPDFSTLTPVATGVATDVNLNYAEQNSAFGLTFDGYIRIDTPAVYTFYLTSDDGSRLWIENELIVDNDGQHGPVQQSGSIALEAGLHEIHIHYFERGGGETLNVEYEADGLTKQTIPSTAWYRSVQPVPFPDQLYDPSAYRVQIADAVNLQTLLDQHGSIRLEAKDYSIAGPAQLTLSSYQNIYGLPGTIIPKLIIPGGTQESLVSYLQAMGGIEFQPSAIPCTGNHFRGISLTNLTVDNATLENNLFVGFQLTKVNINNATSGYLRNNRFVRFTVHAAWPQLVMQGNTTAGFESYGNVFSWFNFLTPHGHATQLDNQQDLTFVGTDAESWNWSLRDNRALFNTGDMGTLRIFAAQGGNNLPVSHHTQLLNTNAQEVQLFGINVSSTNLLSPNIIYQAGNQRSLNIMSQIYSFDSDNLSATRFNILEDGGNDFQIDDISQTSLLLQADADTLDGMIRPASRPGQPWEEPSYLTLPNPAGPDWDIDLASKPDDTAWLQNRIDTEGIVMLEPGTYYISTPLSILGDDGIIGSGMGQTIIIARTNDFDMIRIKNDIITGQKKFTLCNLTLQGGACGLVTDQPGHAYTRIAFAFVQFRDMANSGIRIQETNAWDNNFIDHVSFVNCPTGVLQIPDPNYAGGHTPTMTFLDKNFWYRCQFINCGLPLNLPAKRANNLNAYFECLFEDSTSQVANFENNLTTIFYNCDFVNNAGNPMMQSNDPVSYISCRFQAGQTDGAFAVQASQFEGCYFSNNGLSNIKIVSGTSSSVQTVLINSKSNGVAIGDIQKGLLLNTSAPGITGRAVHYDAGVASILDNRAARPVPNLLWGKSMGEVSSQ